MVAGLSKNQSTILLCPNPFNRIQHVFIWFHIDLKYIEMRLRPILFITKDTKVNLPFHKVSLTPFCSAHDSQIEARTTSQISPEMLLFFPGILINFYSRPG